MYNAILLSNAQGNGIERSNAQQAITVLAQLAGDPNVTLSPENRNAIATLAGKNVLDYASTTSSSTTADQIAVNKDRLTGVALDSTGRYSVSSVVDGEVYKPKYFPCATVACLNSASNLDMSDAGTQAYVKALDAQVFKDIGTGATMGTLVTPVGIPGRVLMILGYATSAGSASTDSTVLDEGLKIGAQSGAQKFFESALKYSPAAASRAVALIDLAGGWDAFADRLKSSLGYESKK